MVFAPGQPKIGGRKPGVRNKMTIAAQERPDALAYVQMVVATEDGTITPDVRLRAAGILARYQHPQPSPSCTETYVKVPGYVAPTTAEEAGQTLIALGEKLARGEISVEAHDALTGSLRIFLNSKAIDQEKRLAEIEETLRQDGHGL